jgi:serine/threonine protein kinase
MLSQQIGNELGKGGFGTVYEGLNMATSEVVALKSIPSSNITKDQLASIMVSNFHGLIVFSVLCFVRLKLLC